MKTAPSADPDIPSQESIRHLLAQALTHIEDPDEVSHIASYLVTGSLSRIPETVGSVTLRCRTLILWTQLLDSHPASFNIQSAVTSRYYDLKRYIHEIS
jgi:hypothetical protein